MSQRVSVVPAGANDRAAARTCIRLPLRFRVGPSAVVETAEAINLSQSGLFIGTESRLEVGTVLQIEITLPEGTRLLAGSAKVVRQQFDRLPHGLGAQFLHKGYQAQGLVERLLSDEGRFGKYRLEALVGRGGMADVYRAFVADGPQVGRTVAIKRLHSELSKDPVFVDLFVSEADITRMLQHQDIVEVIETGAVGDTYYIAMEYVDGCNLFQVLDACCQRTHLLPPDFACYTVTRIARALDYAHCLCAPNGTAYGIVHCDATPSNIFISTDGAMKLGDFGVVHVEDLPPMLDGKVVAGKTPYLAPEQLLGQPLTPATDVFTLGVVLYEMLTNRRPFDGPNDAAIRKQILAGRADPPSAYRSDLPEGLDEVVARALASKREDSTGGDFIAQARGLFGRKGPTRFVSAKALADALEQFCDAAKISGRGIVQVVSRVFQRR